MPPPDPIQAASASYGICLPDGTVEGVEILISPAAAQQSCESEKLAAVQDYTVGMSYSRPVEATRQPMSVLQALPLRGRQKVAVMALGDALQIWINDQEKKGLSIEPELQEIAELLHEGILPNIEDPHYSNFFNKSYTDTSLDAILHSIGTRVEGASSIHAQALRSSLPYYLAHSENPNDSGIRQSLIIALSNSDTETRVILANSTQTAAPEMQAQVHQALSSSTPVTLSSGPSSLPERASPAVASSASSSPLPFSNEEGLSRALVYGASLSNRISSYLLNNPSPTHELTLPVAILTSGAALTNTPTLLLTPDSIFGILNFASSPNSPMPGSLRASLLGQSSLTEGSGAPRRMQETAVSQRVQTLPFAFTFSPLILEPETHREPMIRSSLRGLGLSDSSIDAVFDFLPSPLLLGCASIQGGLQASLNQATIAHSNAPFSTSTNPASGYRVAAISGSDVRPDREGFGSSSQEGSSEGYSGNNSSSQEGQSQEDQAQADEADVYTTQLV